MPGIKKLVPLERDIENAFLRRVKQLPVKLKVRKLNGDGHRSWPDRLLLGPKRFVLLIEFKRPKLGKLSTGQSVLIEELRELEHPTPVFDNALLAFEYLVKELRDHGISI